MRVMAFAGVLMFLVAALGGWLYRKDSSNAHAGSSAPAIAAIALPYIAATAGWILTEMGRQPWIVQGLLMTARRDLARRQHDLDRDQPGRLPGPVRRSSGSSTSC